MLQICFTLWSHDRLIVSNQTQPMIIGMSASNVPMVVDRLDHRTVGPSLLLLLLLRCTVVVMGKSIHHGVIAMNDNNVALRIVDAIPKCKAVMSPILV